MSREGKVFYQHGEYTVMIGGLNGDDVDKIVRKLDGTIKFKHTAPTF